MIGKRFITWRCICCWFIIDNNNLIKCETYYRETFGWDVQVKHHEGKYKGILEVPSFSAN